MEISILTGTYCLRITSGYMGYYIIYLRSLHISVLETPLLWACLSLKRLHVYARSWFSNLLEKFIVLRTSCFSNLQQFVPHSIHHGGKFNFNVPNRPFRRSSRKTMCTLCNSGQNLFTTILWSLILAYWFRSYQILRSIHVLYHKASLRLQYTFDN